MAKYLQITTGDPNDTTTTFSAKLFVTSIDDSPEDDYCEIALSVYRAVAANAPGGAAVNPPIRITASDAAVTDASGNDVQVLYSSWVDANGNIDFENIYTNLQLLTVYWPANEESLDLTTATTLP